MSRGQPAAVALLLVAVLWHPARAAAQLVLPARDHAVIGPPGLDLAVDEAADAAADPTAGLVPPVPGMRRGVGVLDPLRWVLHPCVELQAHPVVFLAAPHASVKVAHARRGPWHLAGDYGLALPWGAQRLLQGYLLPSFQRGTGRIGVTVVPSAGALLSHVGRAAVWTARIDLAAGLPLSRSDLRPLEAPAPIELLFAPILNRYRLHAGLLWDGRLHPRTRARAYADAYLHGLDPDRQASALDHLTFRAGAGADVALTGRLRATLDVMVWNAQQFAVDRRGRRVRSTDVLPVVDLIWAW